MWSARHKRLWLWSGAIVLASLLCAGAYAWTAKQQKDKVARLLTNGDPLRAPAWIRRYGCGGCHTISGVPGADGKVAGPLENMRQRVYVAGVLNNTSDNMVQWIVSPQTFSPRTAMPVTGITPAQARDIVAYLYAQ